MSLSRQKHSQKPHKYRNSPYIRKNRQIHKIRPTELNQQFTLTLTPTVTLVIIATAYLCMLIRSDPIYL